MSKPSSRRSQYWQRWLSNHPRESEKLDLNKPGWKRYARKLNAQFHAQDMAEVERMAQERFKQMLEKAKAKAQEAEVKKEEPVNEQAQETK